MLPEQQDPCTSVGSLHTAFIWLPAANLGERGSLKEKEREKRPREEKKRLRANRSLSLGMSPRGLPPPPPTVALAISNLHNRPHLRTSGRGNWGGGRGRRRRRALSFWLLHNEQRRTWPEATSRRTETGTFADDTATSTSWALVWLVTLLWRGQR